ncbi:MAG TPA: PhaM family polyhydroxyalkanoate granule multifunctional regulatory protein [Usitatibacter sp.]|nr:PhaM family polyhydroxyalkanoate granule multifunctional regulatory protein [Usitatibacter sp.]
MTKPVTPQDVFDMWQKMVNPGAYPLQSLMFPVLDPKEIQKKISELEVVEHWLNANLNMLQLTIQSMQYQLAMLKGGEKAQEVLAGKGKPAEGEVPNPAAWAWKMMAEASRGGAAALKAAGDTAPKAKAAPKRRRKKKGSDSF